MITDPSRCLLHVTGKDRLSWLNGLVTCELKNVSRQTAVYGLFVSRVGKIQSDAWFCVQEDAVLVALPRSVAAEVQSALEAHLIMEDVTLTLDTTKTIAFRAFGEQGTFAVSRGNVSSLDVVPWQAAGEKEDAAWKAFRMEHGLAEFGVDFDKTLLPHEASLERDAVSFQKGCYLGQEVVCMVELRGQVNRKLLLLESTAPMASGAAVQNTAGEDIGTVKSTLGHRGFALLKRTAAENERVFKVEGAEAHPVVFSVPSVPPFVSAT